LSGQLEDLHAVHDLRRDLLVPLGDLGEFRDRRKLGIAVPGPQDVGELCECRVAVHALESGGDLSEVAAHDLAGIDVVLAPARRDVRGRRS
jgi:hypothetical protein